MNASSFRFRATLFAAFFAIFSTLAAAATRPPNIVFILADDLGYGEVGYNGQKKIRTPVIDKLAGQGMRFTQHYSGNAVCAPSRAVFMTGLHPGHAEVRNNREIQPEGQWPIPADAVTIAKVLKQRGYATGAFGKWGLGGPETDGRPLKQGFDRFFGYNCQRLAHNYYPQTLWDDEKVVELDNPKIPMPVRMPASDDPNSTASYAPYQGKVYSADLIAEKAREWVRANKDNPFFLFWPTTVPHLALQVPDDSLAEYLGKFPEQPYTGNRGYSPHYAPHAAYAAMITRFDREIGRLVSLLEELKLTSNTILIFSSDNGPTFNNTGGSDSAFFESAGGLRGLKGDLYEGGVRVPTFVVWHANVKPGSESDRVSGFEDWLPTLLEIAGGDPAAVKTDGISLLPTLRGEQQPPRQFLYREFTGYGGQQSVRAGDWKLVRANLLGAGKGKKDTSPTLELFNIRQDPTEMTNLADKHPDIVERLKKIGTEQHVPSPDFKFPPLDAEKAAAKE